MAIISTSRKRITTINNQSAGQVTPLNFKQFLISSVECSLEKGGSNWTLYMKHNKVNKSCNTIVIPFLKWKPQCSHLLLNKIRRWIEGMYKGIKTLVMCNRMTESPKNRTNKPRKSTVDLR
jgi:hypothetical protein